MPCPYSIILSLSIPDSLIEFILMLLTLAILSEAVGSGTVEAVLEILRVIHKRNASSWESCSSGQAVYWVVNRPSGNAS